MSTPVARHPIVASAPASALRVPAQPLVVRRRFVRIAPYVLLALALAPSVVWVALDQHVWPWDQAWYGQVSVELFYTLRYAPGEWLTSMVHAFGTKAPGVSWLGQLFVPLGALLGGTDRALLTSILLTQTAVLWVVYAALQKLCDGRRLIPLVATLPLTTLPLFVGLSHQYFVEPLQTLAIAWFVFIVARGASWHPVELLAQLVGAGALGMLAKATSPMYCLFPALIGLWYLVRAVRQRRGGLADFRAGLDPVRIGWSVVVAVALGIGALAWYMVNLGSVIDFTLLAYASPVAQLYGAHDTFVNKLGFWLGALRGSFAYAPVAIGVLALLALALVRRIARLSLHRQITTLDVCALVALLQIGLALAVFSGADNQESRYLVPLAPYLAVIVCWALTMFRGYWLSVALVAASIGQGVATNAQALALTPLAPDISTWLTPVDRDASHALEDDSVVDTTCTAGSALRYTIVGVEEPWFNANTMSYVSAKRHEPQQLRCFYTSLGYAESDADRAWDRMLALKTLYFVTLDPSVRLTAPQALNEVSSPILERVENSGLFDALPVPQDPGVVLLKSHAG